MKTVIFNNNTNTKIQPHSLNENLTEDLAEWLSPFFLTTCSHKEDGIIPTHSIMFYSTTNLKFNTIDTIKINIPIDHNESVFFDWNGEIKFDPAGEPAITIKINDTFAALWIPRLRSMFCSDWTHNTTCVSQMYKLWPDLVAALKLKPFTLKTRKAAIKKQQKSLNKKTKTKINITLGCDPEFELLNKETIIRACSIHSLNDSSKEIGADGSGSQVELRPSPGSPTKVVRNIKELIKRFASDYPEFELDAAGHHYPCGGHIHFGGVPTRPHKTLIELLDDFLGEPSLDLSGNARGSYNSLSKWESKPWGFEYRTPPAAIFATPRLTKIALKLCQNLAITSLKRDSVTYGCPPSLLDYMTTGGLTKLEAEYLLLTLTIRPETKLPMRVAWGASTALNSKTSPKIWFRDDWTSRNKEIYNTIKLSKKAPNIVLYGLSANRGNIATIPIPGFELIEHIHPDDTQEGFTWIGLPWKLRMETLDKTITTTIINAIKKHIKGGKQ